MSVRLGSTRTLSRLITCLVLLAIGISKVQAQSSLSSSSDMIANRAFMYDLSNLYIQQRNGNIEQSIAPTTASIVAVANGTVDVAAVSRNIRNGDPRERQVMAIPIAWDALAIIVHQDNPIVNMSMEQLFDLYLGKITEWQQLADDAVEGEIVIVTHREDGAGAEHSLTEILYGNSSQTLTSSMQVDHSDELIAEVEQNINAVAVIHYSNVRDRKIKILALNQILISPTSVQAGDYLLYTPLYLATKDGSSNSRDVRRLVRFFSGSSAKNVMRRNGVIPYSDSLSLASRSLDRARTMQQIRNRDSEPE